MLLTFCRESNKQDSGDVADSARNNNLASRTGLPETNTMINTQNDMRMPSSNQMTPWLPKDDDKMFSHMWSL